MEVGDDHVKGLDQAATCDVTCPLLRKAVTVTQREAGGRVMTFDVVDALSTLGLLRQRGFTIGWIEAEGVVRFESPTAPPDKPGGARHA